MSNRKTRVLIVDDSKTGRFLIAAALRRDPEIEVIGLAGDPLEARDIIVRDQPDVLTLDVEMPHMNGLQFLEKIGKKRRIPVVMVSSLTERGAEASIEALRLGAFDCFAKPSAGGGLDAYAALPGLIKLAAVSRSSYPDEIPSRSPVRNIVFQEKHQIKKDIIAIGSSTGGVEALGSILPQLSKETPPLVIVQHMPAVFTASLAARLNSLSQIEVTEAAHGDKLQVGHAYIAPGGDRHTRIKKSSGGLVIELCFGPAVSGHRPSVDVLFDSVAEQVGDGAVGVILTGMGADGATGLLNMRKSGAITIGQSRTSCVVYGMPRAAAELGATQEEFSLPDISAALNSFFSVKRELH